MYAWNCGPGPFGRRGHRRWETGDDVNYAPVPVDVREDGETYQVRAWLPGAASDGVNLSVEGDTLAFRAELTTEEGKGEFLLQEIYPGTYGRTLTFPSALDPEGAQAAMENGILTISLPKAASARAKTIPVGRKQAVK